jgi:rhamnosyltransferase
MAGGITIRPTGETERRWLSRPMRVLAHIHTFNDADIIDRTIEAVLRQTRPVDRILVVDNASTDGTLEQPSLKHAAVMRHPENLGTSGAVATGIRFALEQNYDWIWIFDADSIVLPDALEKLLDLYAGWTPSQQDRTAFLACLPHNVQDGKPRHGGVFTRHGLTLTRPAPDARHYPCHVTIWSGILYRLAAVREIGLPNSNYVLDRGEDEYGYHVMKAGYQGFIHQDAVLEHNIRGTPSLTAIDRKFGPATLTFYEFPPIRCYYTCRNTLYFALYEAAQGRFGLFRGAVWRVRPTPERPGLMRGAVWRVLLLTLNFVVRPRHHGGQILACFRGMWHGFTGNIRARY